LCSFFGVDGEFEAAAPTFFAGSAVAVGLLATVGALIIVALGSSRAVVAPDGALVAPRLAAFVPQPASAEAMTMLHITFERHR
jgi:hypothetical protein